MKDKAVNALTAVQHLDSFKTDIEESKKMLAKSFKEIKSLGIENMELNDSFWDYILLSIDGKFKRDNEIEDVSIDWETVKININRMKSFILDYVSVNFNLENQDIDLSDIKVKDSFLAKKKAMLIEEKVYLPSKNEISKNEIFTNFLVLLMGNSWEIIFKHLPLRKYGLPQKDILISIMNHLCGEDLKILETALLVKQSMHRQILELKLENLILREYMHELNMNPNFIFNSINKYDSKTIQELIYKNKMNPDFILKYMTDYYDRIQFLYEVEKKNPEYAILVGPEIKRSHLKHKYGTIIDDGIDKLNEVNNYEIDELKSEQKDIEFKCRMLIDKRFNKGMGGRVILQELLEEAKTIDKKENKDDYEMYLMKYLNFYSKDKVIYPSKIENDIEKLACQIGFEELNNVINKENLKGKGTQN